MVEGFLGRESVPLMSIAAIIVAGGKGRRMGASMRKQYLNLAGTPILLHTLHSFLACPSFDRVILAAPQEDFSYIQNQLLPTLPYGHRVELSVGGEERQESVSNALDALGRNFQGLIAVHDGVRPFVSPTEMARVLAAAEKKGAAILAVPAFETMKRVDDDTIIGTLCRDGVWMAQTPQVFEAGLLRRAHGSAGKAGVSGTDDASLVERLGHPVHVVTGSRCNIKITTPDDLSLAALFLPRYPLV